MLQISYFKCFLFPILSFLQIDTARDIIPNGKKLDNLTQEDVDLMFSHINSIPRESLNGRTAYDVFEFFYGEELLKKLHVEKIDKDQVTLLPYLLNIV